MLTAYPRSPIIFAREMPTCADFYLWRDARPEWLGSLALDGYPSGIPQRLRREGDPLAFRDLVHQFLERRDDGILPRQGWPWRWVGSGQSNYVYALRETGLLVAAQGRGWLPIAEAIADKRRLLTMPVLIFPKMSPTRSRT